MAISLIDDMDKLVRPEMRNSWSREKTKVFVVDEKNAFDLRFPGKWKQEFTTKNGGIIM